MSVSSQQNCQLLQIPENTVFTRLRYKQRSPGELVNVFYLVNQCFCCSRAFCFCLLASHYPQSSYTASLPAVLEPLLVQTTPAELMGALAAHSPNCLDLMA